MGMSLLLYRFQLLPLLIGDVFGMAMFHDSS